MKTSETTSSNPLHEELIESNGPEVLMGMRLYESREDFCGALADPTISTEEVYKYYDDFTDSLRRALFTPDSAVYIGENPGVKRLSEVLAGQIACISAVKLEGLHLEDIADIVDSHMPATKEVSWEEVALASLRHITEPVIEARQ